MNDIIGIAYGKDYETYYAMFFCSDLHCGDKCGCKIIADNLTEEQAKNIAYEYSKKTKLPVQVWS